MNLKKCFIGIIALVLMLAFTSCAAKETEGLIFEMEDNNYWVTGYGGSSKNVTIPQSHEGIAVTKIHFEAFKDTDINSVSIGRNVTWIDLYAFSYCKELKKVTLPDKLDTIRGYAFEGCNKIKKIEIPESCWFIGYQAFNGWEADQTITINGSTSSFEEGWDDGCNAKIIIKGN